MANFYFASEISGDIAIIRDDMHHIVRVARHRKGEEIGVLFPPKRGIGRIVAINSNLVKVKLSFIEEFRFAPVKITIVIPPIKEDPLKEIVRHAVELEIFKIIISESERSRKKKNIRIDRLRRIVRESSKQCGNPLLPEIEISDFGMFCPHGLFMDREGVEFSEFHPFNGENCIYVGPEGGFSEKEKRFLIEQGFTGVKFGDMILKSETAALAGIILGKYLWKSYHEKVSILRF